MMPHPVHPLPTSPTPAFHSPGVRRGTAAAPYLSQRCTSPTSLAARALDSTPRSQPVLAHRPPAAAEMAAVMHQLVLVVLLVAGCSCVAAAGVTPNCNGSNACLSKCQRQCPRPQIQVNIELCKRWGREAGEKVAKESCTTTRTYCNAGQKPGLRGAPKNKVSLQQCGNVAFGECQRRAVDMYRWWGDCHRGLSFGEKQCDKNAFTAFFNDEVNDRCNTAVAWVDQKQG